MDLHVFGCLEHECVIFWKMLVCKSMCGTNFAPVQFQEVMHGFEQNLN